MNSKLLYLNNLTYRIIPCSKEEQMSQEYAIGDRIRDLSDSERATVCYVGLVPPSSGEWLGVDWDSKDNRGRHDGCNPKDGKRYFTASGPKSGSFVRPRKVTGGIDLDECLNKRYGVVSGSNAGVDMNEIHNLKREMNAPFIELVGFDRVNEQQAVFSKLRAVDLSKTDLRWQSMVETCSLVNVMDLDISETLVASWEMCCKITRNLKRLKTLTVSNNRWPIPSDKNESDKMCSTIENSLPNLVELVIGAMNYEWKDIALIAKSIPKLSVLQAPYNDISRITRFDETLTGIVDLNLSKNPIAAWSDILWLSSLLPNLKTLAINECLITNIEFPKEYTANTKDVGVERSVSWFPSLTMLQISCCNIDNWASVEALNVISNLAHIKFKFNPILEKESQENGRQLTIAAIKSLTYLNGSKIEKQERRGAEIDFLKKYGLEYLSLKASQDSKEIDIFCNNHPRYDELVNELGAPTKEELTIKDTSLTSSLLPVNIQCPNDSNFKDVVKKLPPGLTIQKLKLLLQRIVKQKAHQLRLSYVSQKEPRHEVRLDNDMRDIFFYSISTGDTILVRW